MGYFPSLLVVAICWLFLQGPGRGLPRAATKRLRELLVNRRHRLPSTGSCFLRTDQLDGETDWKLRLPVACTQRLPTAAVSSSPCRGTNGRCPGRARKLGRPPGQPGMGVRGEVAGGVFWGPGSLECRLVPRSVATRNAGSACGTELFRGERRTLGNHDWTECKSKGRPSMSSSAQNSGGFSAPRTCPIGLAGTFQPRVIRTLSAEP